MARYIDLTKHSRQVKLAAHAIGRDSKRPYIRHDRPFYRPYRNYFCTHDKAPDYIVWKEMYDKGYAGFSHTARPGGIIFRLTRAGLDWIGETLGLTIYYDEEE